MTIDALPDALPADWPRLDLNDAWALFDPLSGHTYLIAKDRSTWTTAHAKAGFSDSSEATG